MPVTAEIADVLRMVGVLGDQQRFGGFPCATAILFDVPGAGADIVEEPFALGGIGDEPALGDIRVVMDKHLADVEDDVANFHPVNVSRLGASAFGSRPEWPPLWPFS
jgi:hypothetical protein